MQHARQMLRGFRKNTRTRSEVRPGLEGYFAAVSLIWQGTPLHMSDAVVGADSGVLAVTRPVKSNEEGRIEHRIVSVEEAGVPNLGGAWSAWSLDRVCVCSFHPRVQK